MSVAVKTRKPGKLFYRIHEVSQITGIKPYVLRYWESEFNQLKPQKDTNDQRRYRKEDIDLINRIKNLLYEERFTIAGARKKLKSSRKRKEKPERRRKIRDISRELDSIRQELNSLLKKYA